MKNSEESMIELKNTIVEANEKSGIEGVFIFTDKESIDGIVYGRGDTLLGTLIQAFEKDEQLRMLATYALMDLNEKEN